MRSFVVGSGLLLGMACAGFGEGPPEAPAGAGPGVVVAAPAAPEQRPAPTGLDAYPVDRLITDDELNRATLTDLSLARNTIYARVGHRFRKTWLDTWFRAQPWYVPSDTPAYDRLTEVDRRNAEKIGAYEASLTADDLRFRLSHVGSLDRPPEYLVQERSFLLAALGEGSEAGPRTPLSDPSMLDRVLTRADLEELSRRDLRLIRNSVFARHGRSFQSPTLQRYFAQKVWYLVDPAYSDALLTPIDKLNLDAILSLENELGGMLTESEHSTTLEEDLFTAA